VLLEIVGQLGLLVQMVQQVLMARLVALGLQGQQVHLVATETLVHKDHRELMGPQDLLEIQEEWVKQGH